MADDLHRISETQHRNDPAVEPIQLALLIRDPFCHPVHSADGDYGPEPAGAVVRFKIDELGVPPGDVINDGGPRTVIRLDEIAAAAEASRMPDW